jgi:hypothetical protein
MKRMVNTILRQYGTDIRISGTGGERTVKGFFQPVRSKSWQSMVNLETPLGEVFRGQYIYIGPGDVEVCEGELLTLGEKHYFLRRVEKYYYGDQTVYTWGMCVEKGVNDTWGSRS